MAIQTYEIHITASASRIIKVRAASGAEALEIAEERATRGKPGPWVIDFPGTAQEHFSVYRTADGEWVGPGGDDGKFSDEDDVDDDEED